MPDEPERNEIAPTVGSRTCRSNNLTFMPPPVPTPAGLIERAHKLFDNQGYLHSRVEKGFGAVVGMSHTSTVVVVEDQDILRNALCEYLRGAGYHAYGAANAQEAHILLHDHQADDMILVTDLVLQGDGGWQLTRWARQYWPNLPIIFMSGYIEEALVFPALAQGNATFLQKPFELKEFVRCIESLEVKASARS